MAPKADLEKLRRGKAQLGECQLWAELTSVSSAEAGMKDIILL